jgi:dolichol-phosphate mannosyltransferase
MDASDTPLLAVSVVLPTYNESESLPVIIPRIAETLAAAGIAAEVIVVDDNSPDGTAEVAHKLAERYPVRVCKRVDERGLATAVLAGFALSRAEVCVVMDADGSHPVDVLPRMVRTILEDKADIVVGSRHVPGGGSKDWPLFSQFKSKLAATLAIGVTSMTDPTTGFLAARRALLQGLDLDPVGWKIVLEIVVKAAPVRVAEVPIIFVDRELGVSKQSLGVFGEYLTHLAKLYAYRHPALTELVKFCAVGVLGMCLDLATVIALKETWGLDTRLCAVFGFIVAVTSNFVLNRKYTFARARDLPWLSSYATYAGTNLAGLAIRMLTIQGLIVLASMDEGRSYVFTNFVGIILATLVNFVGAKFFAFAPERVEDPGVDELPSKRPSSMPPRARSLGLSLLFATGLVYAFATTVPNAQLVSPNEGVNVTMARNIRSASRFFTRPSVYPGGRSDWLHDDVPALGNLPTYPGLLAVAPRLPGFSGMALISFLAFCVTLYSTARLVGLVDPKAGLYTGLLMICSPALLLAFRRIEFEPVLTAFCAAGSYQLVRGVWDKQRLRALLGGALVGLGFATKMWLIVPYAFALIAFCVAEAAAVRRSGQSAGLRKSVAVAAIGFVITACAHLAFVAAVSPADLPVWLGSVYFGIFSGHGVTGAKLSALADYARHQHSPLYYPLVLYRDHFFLLPLCLYGINELLRVPQLRRSRLLAMIGGAVVALVALSVPAYKDPRYVLAASPFLYAFAGLCVAAFARSPDKLRPATVSVVRASMLIACAAFLAVLIVHLVGGPVPISASYVAAHGCGTLLCLLLAELWMRTKFVTRELAILGGLGLLGFAMVYPRVVKPPPYAAIAEVLRPTLDGAAPAYPSFLAPDSDVLQGYLEHSGLSFEDLGERAESAEADTRLRAFVLSPDQNAQAGLHNLVAWLTTHTREVTGELVAKAGDARGFRVFVRR